MSTLQIGSEWCVFRDGYLEVMIEPLSLEQWANWSMPLSAMRRNIPFWIGDWVNVGESRWPSEYTQALDIEDWGYADQTVSNYASICRRVPAFWSGKPHRRVPPLSFSHCSVVAKLPHPEQARWLARAVKEHWSSDQLKEAILGKQLPAVLNFGTAIDKAIQSTIEARVLAPAAARSFVEDGLAALHAAQEAAVVRQGEPHADRIDQPAGV